jgi:hypothetical protein
MCLVPAMSSDRPGYEPSAWLLLVEWIGGALRERYRPPKELPRAWLIMLDQLITKLEIPARDIKGFADETIENLVERDRFAGLDYHERQMERVAQFMPTFGNGLLIFRRSTSRV